MLYNKRNLIYLSTTVVALTLCIILICIPNSNPPSAGKFAGKVTTSDMSVSINNQLIPAYNLKSGVYITAEDLQLFGFDIEDTNSSLKISSPKNSHINREYIINLSDIEENEKAFYPQKQTTINNAKVSSYRTKKYTLLPVSILGSLGNCSKESNSTLLKCDLYN